MIDRTIVYSHKLIIIDKKVDLNGSYEVQNYSQQEK